MKNAILVLLAFIVPSAPASYMTKSQPPFVVDTPSDLSTSWPPYSLAYVRSTGRWQTLDSSWTDVNPMSASGIVMTGLTTASPASVTSSDTLLGAIQKIIANIGALTTDAVAEGSRLYFTAARALSAPLTGFTAGAGVVSAADSILSALQKLAGNIIAKFGSVTYAKLGILRSLATTYTPSATLGTWSCHTFVLDCSASILTSGTCEARVDLLSDSGATPTTVRGSTGVKGGGVLTGVLSLVTVLSVLNGQRGQVCSFIPPGWTVRLVSTAVSGSPTVSIAVSDETTMAFGP